MDVSRGSFIVVLLLAAIARIAAAWYWSGHLADDRDVYRALALGIVEGRGLSSPGTSNPTAYRPPLYPLLLAATGGAHATFPVAILNVVLGTLTVALILFIGRALELGRTATLLAGLLTAVDPLLLYYTAFPMTETLCTCLMTAWLWTLLKMQNAAGAAQQRWAAIAGLLLGLTALCRPTVWACAVLLLAALATSLFTRRPSLADSQPMRASAVAVLLLAAALTVAPWGLRNWRHFDVPIITTTHGGYTLLLGNNPAYYREVVRQPLGVVWDGSHGAGQQAWSAELVRQTEAAGLHGEVERDRWMSHAAWQTIHDEPGTFLRACLRRCLHFWSIVPNVRSDASLSPLAVRLVGGYYALLFASLAIAVVCVLAGRVGLRLWLTPILLIAGFAGVHLWYWSDARMRAPVTPEIALLAACGIECVVRQGRRSTQT